LRFSSGCWWFSNFSISFLIFFFNLNFFKFEFSPFDPFKSDHFSNFEPF
jgi:hypothetical protein